MMRRQRPGWRVRFAGTYAFLWAGSGYDRKGARFIYDGGC